MTTDISFARSGMSDPWGKCEEELKTHIPEETKLLFMERANTAGVSSPELLRYVVNCYIYGEQAVKELHHNRMMGRRAGLGTE